MSGCRSLEGDEKEREPFNVSEAQSLLPDMGGGAGYKLATAPLGATHLGLVFVVGTNVNGIQRKMSIIDIIHDT